MSKVEEKVETVYEVMLVRTDREFPIIVHQSTNYDECYVKWQELHQKWQESSDNNKVFIMDEPFVTAFNPLLIREITLRPIVEQSVGKHKNPYQQKMIDKGLSNMLGGSDILDGGYR
jgi:hypothetical protein